MLSENQTADCISSCFTETLVRVSAQSEGRRSDTKRDSKGPTKSRVEDACLGPSCLAQQDHHRSHCRQNQVHRRGVTKACCAQGPSSTNCHDNSLPRVSHMWSNLLGQDWPHQSPPDPHTQPLKHLKPWPSSITEDKQQQQQQQQQQQKQQQHHRY